MKSIKYNNNNNNNGNKNNEKQMPFEEIQRYSQTLTVPKYFHSAEANRLQSALKAV